MNEQQIKQFLSDIQKENDGNHVDFMLPGYAGRKLVGYQSMRQDLILCKDAIIKFLTEEHDETISSCLFYTFIALYGKCFTDASSSKSPHLELKDFDEEHKHLIETHKELMDMRHHFIAHRGKSEHDIGFPYIKLNIHSLSINVRVKQMKRSKPKTSHLSKYLELLEYLIIVCEQKFLKTAEKTWKHMSEKYTSNELAMLKIAGPIKPKNDYESN